MDKKLFEDLKKGLREAVDHAEGKLELRTTRLPAPPAPMSSKKIQKVRKNLRMSQAVFARHLNVSTKTVQGWEQDLREPSGAALKLLEIVTRHPQVLLD